MAQAKTLTKDELSRVLDYINTRRFAQRNRAMMLLTHLAGLRIGEVACLRWSDVINTDSTVKDQGTTCTHCIRQHPTARRITSIRSTGQMH
jgi:integrase/recombinase XerD